LIFFGKVVHSAANLYFSVIDPQDDSSTGDYSINVCSLCQCNYSNLDAPSRGHDAAISIEHKLLCSFPRPSQVCANILIKINWALSNRTATIFC